MAVAICEGAGSKEIFVVIRAERSNKMARKKKTDVTTTPDAPATDPKILKDLEDRFGGDKELVLFFLAWLKNGRNATEAYLAINPNVSRESAAVMGSMKLRKIKNDIGIEMILDVYGLGVDAYINQLKEGLEATKFVDDFGIIQVADHTTRRTYHEVLGKLLGLEKKDENPGAVIPIQINNLIEAKRSKYFEKGI